MRGQDARMLSGSARQGKASQTCRGQACLQEEYADRMPMPAWRAALCPPSSAAQKGVGQAEEAEGGRRGEGL